MSSQVGKEYTYEEFKIVLIRNRQICKAVSKS